MCIGETDALEIGVDLNVRMIFVVPLSDLNLKKGRTYNIFNLNQGDEVLEEAKRKVLSAIKGLENVIGQASYDAVDKKYLVNLNVKSKMRDQINQYTK